MAKFGNMAMNASKGEITLVSLGQNPSELGLRYLSSVLLEKGYSVKKVFSKQRREDDVSPQMVAQINEISRNSLFIGVSVITDYVRQARNFSEQIRRLNRNVVLVAGGIHPTVRPQEIIDVFDIVVRGEAEQSIVMLADELSNGKGVEEIQLPGVNTRFYTSEHLGFVDEIENLPVPDFSDNYVFNKKDICLEKNYEALFGDCYSILTSRGCPYHCTYCVNDFYARTSNHSFFRKRSVNRIIDELAMAKKNYPVGRIVFLSDNFLALVDDELDLFISRYSREIGFPFYCSATPNCIRKDRIGKMMDIGLSRISMGIESGSENTLALYRRKHGSPRTILQAAEVLHQYFPRLYYSFDLILDNPYETSEDLRDTLSLLESMPRTYDLTLYSLTFYPGTYLYEKAVKDGLVKDAYYLEQSKHYHRLNPSFHNCLFLLYKLKARAGFIAYVKSCEFAGGVWARICRSLAAYSVNILLAVCLLKMIFSSLRNKDGVLASHYVKLGIAVVRSALLRR